MKYMGSKQRFVNEFVKLFNQFSSERHIYIEPFVGGANVIDKVTGFDKKFGYDKNPYLIALLVAVRDGIDLPDSISETEYYKVRDNMNDYPKWYVGLVGFCASYGGRFFEGYPRGLTPTGTPRDYTNEAIRNLKKQSPNLKGILFKQSDYKDLDFTKLKAVIYCDSPYMNSKPYKVSILGKFDSFEFYNWVRKQSEFNPVFISEYTAPDDFVSIWEKGVKSNLNVSNTKTSVEKIFIHKDWYEKIKS